MQERAINISSINRQKIGRSRPEDFVIKFDPVMHLDTEMHHELAVDRVSMTYSWHNINSECVVPEKIHTPPTEGFWFASPHPFGISVPRGVFDDPPPPGNFHVTRTWFLL